jgi:phosphohistidine phosphatase
VSRKLRELILVRHAKSHWSEQGSDFDRPLSTKGKKMANKVGQWLHENQLTPDHILLSPAKRTVQTFKRFCAECSIPYRLIDELYLADLTTLQNLLKTAPSVGRLMIIGHNPGLEELNRFLQGNLEGQSELFPTGSIAHYILPEDWTDLEAGDGHLKHFIRPRDIKLN